MLADFLKSFAFRKVSGFAFFFFWGASSPVCWFNNKEFLCITHTVQHNYISPNSTVGLQLHVSVLYVGHLHVVTWLSEQLDKVYGVFF